MRVCGGASGQAFRLLRWDAGGLRWAASLTPKQGSWEWWWKGGCGGMHEGAPEHGDSEQRALLSAVCFKWCGGCWLLMVSEYAAVVFLGCVPNAEISLWVWAAARGM